MISGVDTELHATTDFMGKLWQQRNKLPMLGAIVHKQIDVVREAVGENSP
jgi:hypothetical protein